MTAAERRCAECGTPLVQRDKEPEYQWQQRRYCSGACGSRGTAKRSKDPSQARARPVGFGNSGYCAVCRKAIVCPGRCYQCATGRSRLVTPETLARYAAQDGAGVTVEAAA